ADRGAPEDRRPQGACGRAEGARPRRPRLPGRGEGRARARDVGGAEDARVRAGLPRGAGAGLLRRGEGAARRSRSSVAKPPPPRGVYKECVRRLALAALLAAVVTVPASAQEAPTATTL